MPSRPRLILLPPSSRATNTLPRLDGPRQRRGQSTTERHEVIDRGDLWIFRFSSQGRQAGELRISRADLQAARWTIQIPDATVQELKDTGTPLPP